MKFSLIILSFFILHLIANGQDRWTNIYFESENLIGESIIDTYDKGYLLTGRYGSTIPYFNWIIKTDINGEVLWNKVLGKEGISLVLSLDLGDNKDGDIYMAGCTQLNSDDNNPIIMKLNSCGEKEWCRIFIQEGNNFISSLLVTPDSGVLVDLIYMGNQPFIDDICLAKFDINGNLQWKQCYTSPDSALHGFDSFDLTLAPDGGFLLSGFCSYEDPNPPHYWSAKPYFLKTDSLGNFEWETVVHKNIASIGGDAYSTVLNPDSTFYYSSLNHNYHSAGDAAALLKMDLSGNVIGVYDLTPPNTYGKMMRAKFISDSTLMASAVWGSAGPPKAVIIDTLGNILYSTLMVNNHFMAQTEVTYDDKLLFMTNMEENTGNFNTYLFKFNQQLESDTIYNQAFTYDSLCPYQIVSDTITQDDCEVIVSNKYLDLSPKASRQLFIYPNPAKDSFVVRVDHSGQKVESIGITDMYGQTYRSIKWYQTDSGIAVDSQCMKNGIYILKVSFSNGRQESGKFVISR